MPLSHNLQDRPVHSFITPFPIRSLPFGIFIRIQVKGCTLFLKDGWRRVVVALYDRRILFSVRDCSGENDHDDRISSQEPVSVEDQHDSA